MRAWKAARNALKCVLETVSGERVIIVCDDEKAEVGKAFADGAIASGLWIRLITLETSEEFRKEVPKHLLEVLSAQKPALYINLLRGIREETPFRIKLIQLETRYKRSRLGHCPGVTLEMLTDGALALTVEEHKRMQDFARILMEKLSKTVSVEVTSPSGTDLLFSTEERPFFTDTILDWKEMKWMNLPTGEVIVAPVEDSLEGTLICNMAIGGIGPLKKPVELTVKNGIVEETRSKNEAVLRKVNNTLETDNWAKVVGEFAFGINPKARFTEEFLEAEKILGTIHIAFGNNTDMPGGRNPSKNHMDFLISKPTVKVTKKSGETITVLNNGKFQIR
ncbi:MAG: aminopeptidase [Candidatus Bathyarchaeota archaeon]|nr:MAG: aminopeptidase [Candidatus Bathyarchaeota archaeon]